MKIGTKAIQQPDRSGPATISHVANFTFTASLESSELHFIWKGGGAFPCNIILRRNIYWKYGGRRPVSPVLK